MADKLSRRGMLKSVGASIGGFGLGLMSSPVTSVLAQEPQPPVAELTPQASYRFTLGDWNAWVIKDGGFSPDATVFASNVEPQTVYDFLDGRYVLNADNTIDTIVNILVVQTANDIVVFDTGLGEGANPGGGLLAATLAANGVDPSLVTRVIVSHWHPDHVGGIFKLDGTLTFPNATYHLSQAEFDFLQAGLEIPELSEAVAPVLEGFVAIDGMSKLFLFNDGDELLPGFLAVAAPGHTPGHTGFLLESAGEQLMNIVDASLNTYIGPANPSWNAGFDADGETAAATRLALFNRLADQRIRMFGYHYSSPGLGFINRVGASDSFVFTPKAF